jgi:membrane peptidoglycan carboxypeptidase
VTTDFVKHKRRGSKPRGKGKKRKALPASNKVELLATPPSVSPAESSEPVTEASAPIAANWTIRLRGLRFSAKGILKKALKVAVYSLPLWIVVALLAWRELTTSSWQSTYFSRAVSEATFAVQPGPNPTPWFPSFGPYDERLGYTRIASITDNLTKNGFQVVSQSRLSPRLVELAEKGIYLPFHEKTRAGITILDRNKTTIYSAYRPERVYESFQLVPGIIINTLLYIENREILDQTHATKNPAVEWDRLGKAVLEKIKQIFVPDLNAPGGSTIATQLEKYRHSREGRTSSARDKFIQMLSASYRAYLYGRETIETRKQIVLNYINSIPLAALRGYGEVNGLGDGLWAWYGVDFDEVNAKLRALSTLPADADVTPYAEPYKQMLSLFIAHRRPSFFLIAGLKELDTLTDTYIDLLAKEGILSPKLKGACKSIDLTLRRAAPKPPPISFVQRKAANAIRTRLLQLMGYPQLYDLDQVDVTVNSTMDNDANEAVTSVLRQIKDQDSVKKFGLSGARNLSKGDPSKVIYSLTLYERVGNANLLRVQTDNFDNPFSINEGTRLDLGSTSKLRTLTTYLDIVGETYDRFSRSSASELKEALNKKPDPISAFVLNELLQDRAVSLTEMLDRALQRRYSANPGESFFTGGGVHTFENFKKEDNGKNATLQEAITHSLNLPFIRLMRDISRYYVNQLGINLSTTSKDRKDPVRMHFLRKFADQEGSHFQKQFYPKYRGKKPHELLSEMIKSTRASAKHAAVMFRYVRPNDSVEGMAAFLRDNLPNADISLGLVDKWYKEFAPGTFNLNDQGYLARVHPLELWLVKFLQDNPGIGIDKAIAASKDERQQVYEWLFKTSHTRAQDIRIRSLIEVESFVQIHKQWKKVGYPFNSMVPSLASAIGSSGDRPVALAELVGIILNDGMRYPLVRLDQLHFAAETPYETTLARNDAGQGERVLKVEVARALKRAMRDVVESGTARRVFNTYVRSDKKPYVIGGKTGTGDHRYETYGPGGHLISSRVVNRTATFAFYIGDRFFGVISAHVPGAEAAKFDFTSALAAELLKILSSALVPMIERSGTELSPFPDDSPSPVAEKQSPTRGKEQQETGKKTVLTPSPVKAEAAKKGATPAETPRKKASNEPQPSAAKSSSRSDKKERPRASSSPAPAVPAPAKKVPLVLPPPA